MNIRTRVDFDFFLRDNVTIVGGTSEFVQIIIRIFDIIFEPHDYVFQFN